MESNKGNTPTYPDEALAEVWRPRVSISALQRSDNNDVMMLYPFKDDETILVMDKKILDDFSNHGIQSSKNYLPWSCSEYQVGVANRVL